MAKSDTPDVNEDPMHHHIAAALADRQTSDRIARAYRRRLRTSATRQESSAP